MSGNARTILCIHFTALLFIASESQSRWEHMKGGLFPSTKGPATTCKHVFWCCRDQHNLLHGTAKAVSQDKRSYHIQSIFLQDPCEDWSSGRQSILLQKWMRYVWSSSILFITWNIRKHPKTKTRRRKSRDDVTNTPAKWCLLVGVNCKPVAGQLILF